MATLLPKLDYLPPLTDTMLRHHSTSANEGAYMSKKQLIFSSQECFYLILNYEAKIAGQICFDRV